MPMPSLKLSAGADRLAGRPKARDQLLLDDVGLHTRCLVHGARRGDAARGLRTGRNQQERQQREREEPDHGRESPQ